MQRSKLRKWVLMFYARRWLLVTVIAIAVVLLLASMAFILHLSGFEQNVKVFWEESRSSGKLWPGQKDEQEGKIRLLYELNEDRTGYIIKGLADRSSYIVTGEGKLTNTDIVIPRKYKELPVVQIADGAFEGCSMMTSIVIPDSVTVIGIGAFKDCVRLTETEIPDSIDIIESYTFSGCVCLQKITIPSSVEYIDENAFENCTSLTDVYYAGVWGEWYNSYVYIDDIGNQALIDATLHFGGE